jgi:hypothetical protein
MAVAQGAQAAAAPGLLAHRPPPLELPSPTAAAEVAAAATLASLNVVGSVGAAAPHHPSPPHTCGVPGEGDGRPTEHAWDATPTPSFLPPLHLSEAPSSAPEEALPPASDASQEDQQQHQRHEEHQGHPAAASHSHDTPPAPAPRRTTATAAAAAKGGGRKRKYVPSLSSRMAHQEAQLREQIEVRAGDVRCQGTSWWVGECSSPWW